MILFYVEYIVLRVHLSLWTESTTVLFVCIWSHPTVQTVDKPHAIAVNEECGSGTRESNSLTCSDPLKNKNKVAKSQDSQMYCQAHTHCIVFLALEHAYSAPDPHLWSSLWYLWCRIVCYFNAKIRWYSVPRTVPSHVWLTMIHLFPSNDYTSTCDNIINASSLTSHTRSSWKRQVCPAHSLLSRFRSICS